MSDLKSDFIAYYNNLPKVNCLYRIYERNEDYYLYGDETKTVNKVLSTLKVKCMESGNKSLSYVKLNKGNLIRLLRHLLFVLQYKVEIFRNTGSNRSQEWSLVGKASPGNLTAVEDFLFSEENAYVMIQKGLMAVKVTSKKNEMCFGIAYCDPLLREIQICQFIDNSQLSMLQSVLAQLSPQECILPILSKVNQSDAHAESTVEETLQTHKIAITKSGEFNSKFIVQDLNRLLKLDEGQDFQSSMKDESEMDLALSCVAAIIKYLELLSDENNFGQYFLSVFKSEQYSKVDSTSEVGLGLFPESTSDDAQKYLFGHLNSCSTSAGERLLIQWIKQPLMDVKKIEERLDIVEAFVNNVDVQKSASKMISRIVDVEMLSRKLQKRTASLQDLYKMYIMVNKLPDLKDVLSKYSGPHALVLKNNFIDDLQERIEDFENFVSMIAQTIDFDAVQNREFIVKAEYDEALSDLRKELDRNKRSMDKELEKTKSDLDLSSLKLELFEKIGYAFRVTLKEEKCMRNKKKYTVIDTRSSGVRFQNDELKNLNVGYLQHMKQYEQMQKAIVEQMVDVSVSYIQPLKLLGNTLSQLDVALSLSRAALKGVNIYVRPKLREKGESHIVLKQCRHPVLENIVDYIPNDIEITNERHRFYFVTGPNMGGKSTYIRSVALNVLLAQIGSFVPCEEADVSVVDAFFTRIGACDKPSKAVSTFMYEMLEVKNILNYATPSSLLIIDEMGRGTSTFDGLGLSWAISRHIAEVIKAPCLFATHFHNLTELSQTIPTIGNIHVDALCTNEAVTFLYRIKPGVCSESFGIHVAKLAELPQKVLDDATQKLKELEESYINFDQVSSAFSKVTDGDKFVQLLKDVLSSEVSTQNCDEMEVDEQHNFDGSTSPSESSMNALSSIFEVSKAEHLLRVLESMEKEM